MRSYPVVAIIFFLSLVFNTAILVSKPSSAGTDNDTLTGYLKLYDELIHLDPDPEYYLSVENFTFKRDVAQFQLRKGDLFFCKPVRGRICAGVFIGDGLFSFTPPTKIEKDHLYRYIEKDSVEEEFNFLFIMFGDDTFQEFQSKLSFSENDKINEHQRLLDYALEYMGKKKEKTFNYDVVKSLLDGDRNDLFYAHFSDEKINPKFFRIVAREISESVAA